MTKDKRTSLDHDWKLCANGKTRREWTSEAESSRRHGRERPKRTGFGGFERKTSSMHKVGETIKKRVGLTGRNMGSESEELGRGLSKVELLH